MDCHRDYPENWVMHVFAFGIDAYKLDASSPEEAKKEAIEIVKKRVAKIVADANRI